jgi:hypothetical protein
MLPFASMKPMGLLSQTWKWLTRAYCYEFDVVRPFVAGETISGAQREFKPGDRVLCDSASKDSKVMFEMQSAFFTVERSVFEASCKPRKPVTMPS